MNGRRRHFIDSNVFIYAYDASPDPRKERALAILTRVIEAQSGAVSTQVLSETYVNLVRLGLRPASHRDARQVIEAIASSYPVLPVTSETVADALEITTAYSLSYWDSLLVAAARAAGAETLLTEDLQAEQVIEGVRVLHVLDPEFDLSRLG